MAFTDLYYIDISKIGRDFTGKRDISIVTNENAISESIQNILGTQPGHRVMHPLFGCNLDQFLFSPIDPITALRIRKTIEDAINIFEKRVENLKVNVIGNEDNYRFDITIIYNTRLVKTDQTVSFKFELTKVR